MTAVIFTSILSFVSTNIDNIFILMLLYAQVQARSGILRVAAGQFLGIGLLTAVSIAGALGTQLFPPHLAGLLGFLPLFLGIRAWFSHRSEQNQPEQLPEEKTQAGFLSSALLAIANGADNIGVYIPVFSGCSLPDFAVVLLTFAGMQALWCVLALKLANQPYIREKIRRFRHVLVPAVMIFLGISILAGNFFAA